MAFEQSVSINPASPDFNKDSGSGDVALSNFVHSDASDTENNVESGLRDDRIELGGGDDQANGNNGNDTVLGEDGNDTVNGGVGHDKVIGGDGNDVVLGSIGNDTNGRDTIIGGTGQDVMDGYMGDDFIIAGDRVDWNQELSDGQDVILFDSMGGHDTVWGFNAEEDVVFLTDGEDSDGIPGIDGLSFDYINGKHTLVTYNGQTMEFRNEIVTEDNFLIDTNLLDAAVRDAVIDLL